jgi:hypothetical protein
MTESLPLAAILSQFGVERQSPSFKHQNQAQARRPAAAAAAVPASDQMPTWLPPAYHA